MRELRNKFSLPDPQYGPVPFWWWSGEEVTEERIRWQLQKFRAGGLRNIGIIHLAPTGPQYGTCGDRPVFMSEEWWQLFEAALREAERLGMRLWFYDQIGFSGANELARLVAANPEYSGYHLRRFSAEEKLPEGAKILLETTEYRYAEVRQGFNWLDPQAAGALLDRVHGEMERRFPNDLGKTIAGSFQDELPPLPLWSPEVPIQYAQRFGEDLIPHLAALFDDVEGAETIRRRVYRIAAELAERSLFIPLGQWHRKYNMVIGCDQAGPARRVDPHAAQRLYLDYFRTHRWYNSPGADMEGELKPHSSMVHLNGGSRVWLEAFHSSGWGGTIEETMHWLVPWLQAGATLFSPHAVYYTTRGGWWEWAPPDTGWRQPYFEHYGVFADTVSRACHLLSSGAHVCNIAVHYPSHAIVGHLSLDDVKPREHPMAASNRDPNEKVAHLRQVYLRVTGAVNRRDTAANPGMLRSRHLDFDIVDDSVLERTEVRQGQLSVANETFSVLVLCGTTIMDEAAKQQVKRMAEQGGLVIGVQVPKEEQMTLPGALYVQSAEEMADMIEQRIPKRSSGPGLTLQRRTGDADVFLLLPEDGSLLQMHEPASESMTPLPPAEYRLNTSGVPELWDPVSGRIVRIPYEREGEWIRLEVQFRDWPAALIVCPHGAVSEDQDSPNANVANTDFPARTADHDPAEQSELPKDGVAPLRLDSWRVKIVPTLDNRYGDFDLHTEHRGEMPPERRNMLIRTEFEGMSGIDDGWYLPDHEESGWEERLWSEAAYWLVSKGRTFRASASKPLVYSHIFGDLAYRSWAGRMGRVPRRYLSLGDAQKGEWIWAQTHALAPSSGRYGIRAESNGEIMGWINGEPIDWEGGFEEQTAWIHLNEGANTLLIRAKALKDGLIRAGVEINSKLSDPLPKWIYAGDRHPGARLERVLRAPDGGKVRKVYLVFAGRGRAVLQVNGVPVTEHGDFNPYVRQGQEQVDVTSYWRDGENVVTFLLPEGEGDVFADGRIELQDGRILPFCTGADWKDEHGNPACILHSSVLHFAETESLWINPRPHPLPGVGWLMPESIPGSSPVSCAADIAQLGRPVWLRFPLPVGAKGMEIDTAGQARVWINGIEVPYAEGKASFPPQAAGTIAVIRVVPEGNAIELAVLNAPIRFHVVPFQAELGDWRTALELPHHSGAVEYETTLELGEDRKAWLDLGHIRGTAEVWLDGKPIGIRVWRPYQYALGALTKGAHRIRIRVTNTLGTHYEIGRPTSLVGANPDVTYWDRTNRPEWRAAFPAGGLYGPVQVILE
ncbi:hypothetical protein CJP46_03515 [Paenibacillus sp. XY044]|nr:hypothetical protein CJP46_03515 [Paenibacillus sp. XY044]